MARSKTPRLDVRDWDSNPDSDLDSDMYSADRFEKLRHHQRRKTPPELEDATRVRQQFHRSRWD